MLLIGGPVVDWLSELLEGGPWGDDAGARLLFLLLLAGYEVLFLASHGQTPGMDRLDVKVARTGTDADPGAGRVLRRTLPLLAFVTVPDLRLAAALAVLVLAAAYGRRDRRALHDLVGGTWVISHDADGEQPAPGADLRPLDDLRRRRRLIGPEGP